MKTKYFFVLVTTFLTVGVCNDAQAFPFDLSDFTLDAGVDFNGGTVTIDEENGNKGSSFYNDNFKVDPNAISLTVDYSFSTTIYNFDWLVVKVNDVMDFALTGNVSGIYTLDLSAYLGDTISLSFALEPDASDSEFGSLATFSNFDLVLAKNLQTPVPEPATAFLFLTGFVGIAVFRKMS